jgi:hypothetical protein
VRFPAPSRNDRRIVWVIVSELQSPESRRMAGQ